MRMSRKLAIAFALGLLLALAADAILILMGSHKAALWGESIPGYWAALGLLSFFAIVGVSKLLGDLLLVRPESYYEQRETSNDD